MEAIKKLSLLVLYLTPIGYLLSLASLITGDRTPGVYVHIPRDKKDGKMFLYIKKNPSLADRIRWFVTGLILSFQAYWVVYNGIGGDFGGGYAIFAAIYGLLNIVVAINPAINWKKKIL